MLWRERARQGPYRSDGDVAPNSPGDWARISSHAAEFLDDPGASVWEGPERLTQAGCVKPIGGPRNNNNPPLDGPTRLRDAAFYYLITDDADYQQAVRSALLDQAAKPGVDFSDGNRFCPGVISDHSPAFDLANWLTKLIYAYDYLGAESFTSEERNALNTWFYDAAGFFSAEINNDLGRLFVDRADGDLTLTEIGNDTSGPEVGYLGSKPIYTLHRFYNNRRASQARFVAAAAVKLSQENYAATGDPSLEDLEEMAKRWVTEWITYSVFPEGFFGEFQRWTGGNPDLGWAYAGEVVTSTLVIADLFARSGDMELYEFKTTEGSLGTESEQSKDLLFAAQVVGRYVDGTYVRYGTAKNENDGKEEFLIDGDDGSWHGLHDVQIAVANVYFRDPDIQRVYLRAGNGYPAEPAPAGQHSPWNGDWGTLPGVLFMFGQTEGIVWPYEEAIADVP